MMRDDTLGKKAESKIQQWLDRPEEGYNIYRIKDQMSGLEGSKNPADFVFYKYPYQYWIESKATYEDRFEFSMITDHQYSELMKYSKIHGVYGLIIVLFAAYQRAFIIDIREIDRLIKEEDKHSLNIKKIDKWKIKYKEIRTEPSRKAMLDYTGDWIYP